VRKTGHADLGTPGGGVVVSRESSGEVEADIKETLGLVPHFFSRIPDSLLEPEWEIFKRMELGETLIPNKYKELMGVALHAETKCYYCTLFHTEAAKVFGATDEETQEAVHYAKTSLGWSAYPQRDPRGLRRFRGRAGPDRRVHEVLSVELTRVRPTVLRATLHAYELAALMAAVRYIVESGPTEIPDEAREQLRGLLADYEELRKLPAGHGSAR
jgi:AhpD family alkylhydroperoxidase